MYIKATRLPIDEETPLLHDSNSLQDEQSSVSNIESRASSRSSRRHSFVTPLPWSQLSIMLLVLIAEPMTSQVISPFAPELMRDVGITHGDDGKIGYYVGLMQSLFFATEAMTIMHWSRASDKYGRRPILMTGLAGVFLSMILFGLSKTFWQLVVSRSLAGVLNGNVGVAKSVIAEISDSTNLVDAFSYIPMTWAVGLTIGPAIGGYLSNPTKRFPEALGHIHFLKEYPYFLPCLISAFYSALVCLIVFCFLKETVKPVLPETNRTISKATSSSTLTESHVETSSSSDSFSKPRTAPMRRLLAPAVITAVTNYALVALSSSFYMSFLPVFFATPIPIGGLGLPPSSIGSILTAFGVLNGVIQILMFARLNRWLGTKNLCFLGLFGFLLQFTMFPIINWLARNELGGVGINNTIVWCAISLQIVGNVLSDMLFGCILIYVSASSPTKSMLGATNGLAQMATSIMRAIGPAVINSLFSWSIEGNILGGKGYIVYAVQLGLLVVILKTISLFPREPWKNEDE